MDRRRLCFLLHGGLRDHGRLTAAPKVVTAFRDLFALGRGRQRSDVPPFLYLVLEGILPSVSPEWVMSIRHPWTEIRGFHVEDSRT